MKFLSCIAYVSALLLLSVLSGCGEKSATTSQQAVTKKETAVEHAQKHLDPKYVCPMHPQVVRDAPGACPICGMELVVQVTTPTAPVEQKILRYRHPHNPAVTSDKPMKDEMGMDYVPVYADVAASPTIAIAPQVVQNMGVRTTPVIKDKLVRVIDTVGTVEVDEQTVHHVHLRTQGWIENLYVSSSGERVKKNQLLFEVYSPDLVNAQLEFIQAANVGNPRLLPVSRERLLAMGLAEKQIARLSKTRKAEQLFQVYAPQDGIVEGLNVRHGMYVMPNTEVMAIANLDQVWILVDVLERQSAWIQPGQPAQVHLDYLPEENLIGKVEYVYPRLNPKTRTLRVRLRFDNSKEILKPDMFARVSLLAEEKPATLLVPREAVIRSSDTARVILALGEGRFSVRPIKIGLETSEQIEVLEGLQEGEQVVTSGQFLLDSEASLKASLQRLNTEQPVKTKPVITGSGILRRLEKNSLNLSHEPIAALQWPAMIMDFSVAPEVSLQAFKVGDKVEFDLQKKADEYVITALRHQAK